MSINDDIKRLKKLRDAYEIIVELYQEVNKTLDDFMEAKNIKAPKKPTRNFKQPSLTIHTKEEFYQPKEIKRDRRFLIPLVIGCFIFASTCISALIPSLIAFVSNPSNALGTVFFVLTLLVLGVSGFLICNGLKRKKEAESLFKKETSDEKAREEKALEEMSLANISEKKKYDEEIKAIEDMFQANFETYRMELRAYESRKTIYTEEYDEQRKKYANQLSEAFDIYNALNKKWFPDVEIEGNNLDGMIDILSRGMADNAKEAMRILIRQTEQCSSCCKQNGCRYRKSNLGDCPSFEPIMR